MGLVSWLLGRTTNVTTDPLRRVDRARSLAMSAGHGATAVAEPPEDDNRDADRDAQDLWWTSEEDSLTEPVTLSRPELTHAAIALENLLVSHFDGHNLTLPPLLHVAERVLPRLSDREYGLSEAAKEIGQDPVIAGAVLRMANCPLYRGLNKIGGLQQAVTRLGAAALRTLLMHESLRAALFGKKHGAAGVARVYWQRSLAVACVMRGLGDFTDVDVEESFLIGLLHDIGNIVVLRIVYDDQSANRYEVDFGTLEYLCHECHQEFGELIADAWGLPPTLRSLIADHHRFPDPEDPLRVHRLQLQLSDMIASQLGYGPSASYRLLETRHIHELGLSNRDDFIRFLSVLPDQFAENVEAF